MESGLQTQQINAADARYSATLFDPSLPGGKARGEMVIESHQLRLQTEDTAFTLPLDGLQVALGGAGNRLLFLSHPSHPDRSAYTLDHTILREPAFDQWSDLNQARRKVRRFKRVFWGTAAALVFLAVTGGTGLWLARKPLVSAAVNQIPPSVEIALGDAVITQFVDETGTSSGGLNQAALIDPLRELTQPLIDALDDSPYHYKLYLLEDNSINAFAVPGGHIVVHTGLILKAASPEQIQGVLAHELGHVDRRHSLKQLVNQAGTMLIISFALGDISALNTVVAGQATKLLSLSHSRDAERDADDFGFKLLQKANINPAGLAEFFRLLEKEHAHTPGSDALAFMSTHPATNERIQTLQSQQSASTRDYPESPFDLAAYQATLQSYLDQH